MGTFALLEPTLLRSLPYPESDRLVLLSSEFRSRGSGELLSEPEFLELRERFPALELAGHLPWRFNWTGAGPPEQFTGARVSEAFLRHLGARYVLGGGLGRADEEVGSEPAVVVSQRFWRGPLAGDPGVVGRRIQLNERPHRVVGVLAADFRPLDATEDLFSPLQIDPANLLPRDGRAIQALGRLSPGVGAEAIRSELAAHTRNLGEQHPEAYPAASGHALVLTSLPEHLLAGSRSLILVLFLAGLLVLGVAGANTLNLVLVREAGRRREVFVRAALGASVRQLCRPGIVEMALLASAALGVGTFGALWCLQAIAKVLPEALPGLAAVGFDGWLALFALVVLALLTCVLGATPALWALWPGSGGAGAASSRASTGRAAKRFREALVAAQVALALVIVVSAGLLVRTYCALEATELGFEPRGVLSFQLFLPRGSYPERLETARVGRQVLAELAVVPTVEGAALVSDLPFEAGDLEGEIVAAEAAADLGQGLAVDLLIVSPEFFPTLKIPVRQGRDFQEADRPESSPVVILDEGLVGRLWPAGGGLGRRVKLSTLGETLDLEVVGVVGSTRHAGMATSPRPQVYLPLAQRGRRLQSYVLRTSGPPLAVAGAVRSAVQRLVPTQPLVQIRPLEEARQSQLDRPRVGSSVLLVLASAALLLAFLGLYSVTRYTVTLRSREFAVRVVQGASPSDISRLVLRRGALQILVGLVGGLLLAAWWVRGLTALLFGVQPYDPLTLTSGVFVIIGLGFVAVWNPAFRASRVDPSEVLRSAKE